MPKFLTQEKVDLAVIECEVLSNPSLYVSYWLQKNGVSFSINGTNTFGNKPSQDYTLERLFNLLWLDYELQCKEYVRNFSEGFKADPNLRIQVVKESTMQKAFYESRIKVVQATKDALKASLLYNPNAATNGLEIWLRAITGEVNQLDLAVMKQFVWTIKRRMLGMYPEHIKLPIIYGKKQQTGKTTAIKKLLKPLEYFKLDRNVAEVMDERNTKALGQFYVCFLDEMAGMQRAEVETLKRIITAEHLTFRPMRSNENETVFVTCSFIGASNKPLEELVFDTTGQARFWQINASDEINHEQINLINYLDVWQSINENNEKGYILPYLNDLSKIQEEATMEDFVKIFLDEMGFVPNMHDKFVSVSDVHEAYSAFCAIHGERPKTAAWFSRTAKKYGLKSGSIVKNKGRGYRVNNEFLKDASKVNSVKKELSCLTQ